MKLNAYRNCPSPELRTELSTSFILRTKSYPASLPSTTISYVKPDMEVTRHTKLRPERVDHNETKMTLIDYNASDILEQNSCNGYSIHQHQTEQVGPIYDKICRETSSLYAANVVIATDDHVCTTDRLSTTGWGSTVGRSAGSRTSVIQWYNSTLDATNKSVSEATLTLSAESSDAESARTTPLPAASPPISVGALGHRRIQTDHSESSDPQNGRRVYNLPAPSDDVVIIKRNFMLNYDTDYRPTALSSHTQRTKISALTSDRSDFSSQPFGDFQSPTSISAGSPSYSDSNNGTAHNTQIRSWPFGPSSDAIVETEYAKLMEMFTRWELMTGVSSSSRDAPHTDEYADMQRALMNQQRIVHHLWAAHVKHGPFSGTSSFDRRSMTEKNVTTATNDPELAKMSTKTIKNVSPNIFTKVSEKQSFDVSTKISSNESAKKQPKMSTEAIDNVRLDLVSELTKVSTEVSLNVEVSKPLSKWKKKETDNIAQPNSLKAIKLKLENINESSRQKSTTKLQSISVAAVSTTPTTVKLMGLAAELAEFLRRRRTAAAGGFNAPREKCGVELGRVVEYTAMSFPPLPLPLPAAKIPQTTSKMSMNQTNPTAAVSLAARDDLMAAIRNAGGFQSLKRIAGHPN